MRARFLSFLSAVTLALAAIASLAVAPAQAATSLPVCSTTACVTVTQDAVTQTFRAAVTCKGSGSVGVGVRAYFANGNYSTSRTVTVACSTGRAFAVLFAYTATVDAPVGFKGIIYSGSTPSYSAYTGLAVPSGGHEAKPSSFHWD